MPRDGGTPLARFAQAIARDDGLTVGTPWPSDDGSAVVLPILRTAARPRRCAPAWEAPDQVSAVDSGRLDRLIVRNDALFAVFLPPGALFRSQVTASRATTAGVVIGPRSDASLDVKCVHGSRALMPGAPLDLDLRLAPADVCRALLSRDQGRVWAAVANFVGPSRANASDDLVAALGDRGTAGDAAHGASPEMSSQPGQCGMVLLDARGVAEVEWFDNPESWKAVARSGLRHPAGRLRPASRGPWTVSLDAAEATRVAKEFLARLGKTPLRRTGASNWGAADSSLSITTWGDDLLHLIAFGRQEEADRRGDRSVATAVGISGASWPAMEPTAVSGSGDGDVAAVGLATEGVPEDDGSVESAPRPRRRKVLTSGWDGMTFDALERYARKEFRGDRSAAMRLLVRHGLRTRGYLGPQPSRESPSEIAMILEPEPGSPPVELARAGLEARLGDLERIAQTPQYAAWLRKRSRLELERMASSLEDDLLRTAARSAVERLSPLEPETERESEPEPTEPMESETPPAPSPPPVDVRPLLRQAFAASAAGDYRQAIMLFDQVLAADTANRTARLGRAVALRRAGKSQEALEDLDVVLSVEPRNAAALLARGQILQARGDLDGALASFDLLVDVAVNDWDVWMARGDVLAKMGRHGDALRSYGEALRRNPEDQGLQGRMRTLEKAGEPVAPKTLPRPAPPPGIEDGQSYLVWEARHERSFAAFRALAAQKVPSLILTGRSRDVVRREAGVGSVRIIGLGYTPGEDVHNPTALASLTRTVERFVEDNQGHGVILLDGLDDLVGGNGFRDTLLFIEHLNEAILQSRAVLLVSVAPDAFEEKEAALLERSLRTLP